MENKTPKAIWQKPEIVDLDIDVTAKPSPEYDEGLYSGVSPS